MLSILLRNPVIAALAMLFVATGARSAEEHQHHSLDAHTHGIASLSIAIEQQNVWIELHSPAANIVGFEHKARTTEQRQQVTQAKEAAENAAKLFEFSGTRCTNTEAEFDFSAVTAENDHHDHAHHHEHSQHAEIQLNYVFNCKNTGSLKAMKVLLHQAFPGIEHLETQWITATSSGANMLNPHQTEISFK